MVRVIICALLFSLAIEANAQFATASVSRTKVVVEQPVKVKVTAYSPTWFAEPLSFRNLQVNGAFIQSFSRTISGIQYVNNKKYATLEFFYIVFPYQAGEILFPELEISTSIPPEGDYKGKPVTLKTKPITIQVDPVPENADKDHWLVAENASISNRWSSDLSTAKVGDVINRTITIKAAGTLPSFIDEPEIGQVDFASVYSSEPTFEDERDDKRANGKRVDVYAYLLEEEGTFTIPEVVMTWYNPHTAKYYSRKLPEYEIVVAENLEINALQQLKDSLNAMNQPLMSEETEEAESIDILTLVKWTALLVVAILVISWLLKIGRKVRQQAGKRRDSYRDSETFWFNRMTRQKESRSLLNALYQWLDRSGSESKVLRTNFANDREISGEINELEKQYFSKSQNGDASVSSIISKLKRWKRKNTAGSSKARHSSLEELNP